MRICGLVAGTKQVASYERDAVRRDECLLLRGFNIRAFTESTEFAFQLAAPLAVTLRAGLTLRSRVP
jgi:hypothetical protein